MRTTISLPDEVATVANEIMTRECRRNFSSLCEVAILEYAKSRGANSGEAEVVSAAREVGTDKALVALRRLARKK